MLFASFDFLLFFAVVFTGYWALRGRLLVRALWVTAASYFFYMGGSKPVDGPLPTPWYFAGLLLFTTLTSYAAGLGIEASRDDARRRGAALGPEERYGQGWFYLGIGVSLGLLGYFKYVGFLSRTVNEAAALAGAGPWLPVVSPLLPVGISFYTFQAVGYVIDVYRGRSPAERNPLRFCLFLCFFPHLVAGPIVRASDFLPQLDRPLRLDRDELDQALFRIARGLVKKVLFGDFIAASFVDRVFASPLEYGSLENLLALYGFTLQIYCDFSGYSDIAIGVARLLGVRFPENFDRPYQAVDVADFWRRWHMTLSSWLRDYVYYPLGGSRLGEGRTYLNLWLTLFLVGIWHGAGWTFVIYAVLQASAMVFNRFTRHEGVGFLGRIGRGLVSSALVFGSAALFGKLFVGLASPWTFAGVGAGIALVLAILPRTDAVSWLRPLHVLVTLHFCVLSRVFFRADTLDGAREIFKKLVAWDGFGVRTGLFGNEALSEALRGSVLSWASPVADWCVLGLLVLGFAMHYLPAAPFERAARRFTRESPAVLVGVGFALLFGALGLLLAGPRANIYFAF
jgi:alginate O-acetyltransferase complex protein AlgI